MIVDLHVNVMAILIWASSLFYLFVLFFIGGSFGLMIGRWLKDREVPGSNPALTTGIFLSKKFIPHLLLSTQVYKWVPVREISQCAVAANCAEC
ncbi:hypothetical protein DPMN_008953 [Dreissena polymorpha]|uniref:Uncharacterized protein n=1 Tax=Dreissena polymorpha TaxID=45954 RepID=A0A9D4N1G2_DREPO|nr:hypothetical protein DPMN_008953 [Dreissena polymorpha]